MSEMMGLILKTALALLGVVVVVGLSYTAIQNSKNSNHVAEVVLLSTSVQAAVQTGAFSSLTVESVIAGSKGDTLAPTSMISGNGLTNPWGGIVTIAVDSSNASQFVITSEGVSTGGCGKLAGTVMAKSVNINGTSLNSPVDEPTARTACKGSNSNTIAMTFTH